MAEGIKGLVGRKMQKNVKFMNEDVKISKLSISQVLEIQTEAKTVKEGDSGFELLKRVICMSVEGGSDLSDEDFDAFPMDELSKLSAEIMRFSGIAQDQGK